MSKDKASSNKTSKTTSKKEIPKGKGSGKKGSDLISRLIDAISTEKVTVRLF